MCRLHAAACVVLAGFVSLTGCQTQIIEPAPPAAAAYVGPGALNLRPALADKNAVVAVLHHGDRVQVLETRRRFVRIRTANNATGWVDAIQLLTPEHMAQLQAEAQRSAALPSQGAATAFEELNVHLEPARQSASFARIPEGGRVQVLGHKISGRSNTPPKVPVFNIPKPVSPRKARKQAESKNAFPFPHPKPPEPPESELAQTTRPAPPAQPAGPQAPVVLEDWSLIRMQNNLTGWVLSRNLMMSIPDEVAQYAEGKHITSYFDLGAVNDEEKGIKHHWLWTTTSQLEPFDFDSWRVFIWNRRRHRYETSYRARGLEGYFPVSVDPADPDSPNRAFHLIVKGDDGKLWAHSYTFDGVLVHAASTTPYSAFAQALAIPSAGEQSPANARPGWFASHWNAVLQKMKKK